MSQETEPTPPPDLTQPTPRVYPPPQPGTLTCDIVIQVREGRFTDPIIRCVGRPVELSEVKEVLQKSIELMEARFFARARELGILFPGSQSVIPLAQAAGPVASAPAPEVSKKETLPVD